MKRDVTTSLKKSSKNIYSAQTSLKEDWLLEYGSVPAIPSMQKTDKTKSLISNQFHDKCFKSRYAMVNFFRWPSGVTKIICLHITLIDD